MFQVAARLQRENDVERTEQAILPLAIRCSPANLIGKDVEMKRDNLLLFGMAEIYVYDEYFLKRKSCTDIFLMF